MPRVHRTAGTRFSEVMPLSTRIGHHVAVVRGLSGGANVIRESF